MGGVFYEINLAIGRVTGQPWALDGPPGMAAFAIVLLAIQALALLWRRSRPLLMFAAVYLVFVVLTLVDGNRDLAAGPTLWIAVFFLAAKANARVAVPTLGVAAVGDVALQLPWLAQAQGNEGALWLVSISAVVVKVAVVYMICACLGVWAALQRRRAKLAAERAALVQKQSEADVREAINRERNRMARELHDVAAHHLSGIAIQSQAAMRVHPADPDTVAGLLRDIREQSINTLTSLRQIVGILRDGDVTELSPQPMLSDVGDLVASARRLGTAVDLSIDGDCADLTPAISLACYRVVQESLSNAQKHAAGSGVMVKIHNAEARVEIAVENGRPTCPPSSAIDIHSGGYGLSGMRDRIQILGGQFEANPTPNGGWRNSAIIPKATSEAIL